MTLNEKRLVDFYVGGTLIFFLRPLVFLAGKVLRRNHALEPKGTIVVQKILGGGSLLMAYPGLIGLRKKYPDLKLHLVTTETLRPFAETLLIFDQIHAIDDSSFPKIVASSARTLLKCLGADTVIDLEVHSRLSTVFSILALARNRLGFYLESAYWKKFIYTHLLFFNRFSATHLSFENLIGLLGAEPVDTNEARRRMAAQFRSTTTNRTLCIGVGCSDLSKARMLSSEQWEKVFERHFHPDEIDQICFLGSGGDRNLSSILVDRLSRKFPSTSLVNDCGNLSLRESLNRLANATTYWGIDSSLLHYARLLGIRSRSFWGPTRPNICLPPIDGLIEEIHYNPIPCSPCIHVTETPPCQGRNICMEYLINPVTREKGLVIVSRPDAM